MWRAIARKLQALKRLTVEPVPYDPSRLGDEVAARTKWGPAKSGGVSFATHRLVDAGARRVEFRATGAARFFYGTFVGIGMLTIVFFPVAAFTTTGFSRETVPFLLLSLVLGSVFAAGGVAMWYNGAAPIVFDKQRGEYWKGRVAPEEASNRQAMKDHVRLDRIYALQLIGERVRGKNSSFNSYELNLVLDDATRMNVVDHGNREGLRADAEALARFLGKPVWDATE